MSLSNCFALVIGLCFLYRLFTLFDVPEEFLLIDDVPDNCYRTRPEMIWMYAHNPSGTHIYKIDLREVRSGNLGDAENTLRNLQQTTVPDYWTPFERRKLKLDIAELELSIADGKTAVATSH